MDYYCRANMLSKKMQDCLQIYEDMLGEIDASKVAEYGFIPGLQMSVEALVLKKQRENLKKGVFQVLFTGENPCGKTTLLSALARKDIFRIFFLQKILLAWKECASVKIQKNSQYTKNPLTDRMS